MSKAGVIVALLVALALSAAAFLLGGKGHGPAPATGPLLAFDPATVRELRLTHTDGSFEAARRGAVPGQWDVVLGPTGGGETLWPADPGRIRAALRILSTLEGDPPADAGAAVEAGAPELRLSLDDGSQRQLRISSKPLAGRVLVQVISGAPARPALVSAEMGAMLATGPREWRDHAALPGLGPDVSIITLRGQQGTLSLGRIQGRWGLREPIAEAADPEAVARLVAVLSAIQVTDFLDAAPPVPAATGMDQPTAEVVVASDQRDADGKSHTLMRTLRIGRQADIAGKTVFASMPVDETRARTVVVAAECLSGLHTDPAAYLSRRTLQAPAADVGRIVLTPRTGALRRFQRDLDGWVTLDQAGSQAPATKADADALAVLLNLITQMPADAIEVAASPPQAWGVAEPLATLDCLTLGGAPIASVGVLTGSLTGKPAQVLLQSGKVFRRYPVEASSPLVAWLAK